MKNLLIFLFGVSVGAGGAFLWLRKDIKEELEDIRKSTETIQDEPFVMDDIEHKESDKMQNRPITSENKAYYDEKTAPVVKSENRTQYQTIEPPVFTETSGEIPTEWMDWEDILGIDVDEYMHNHEFEKQHLVYFMGDKIMSTEEGVIIPKFAQLVGNDWEKYVGKYSENTAFIRNVRLNEDYEIFVENGLYSNEYGMPDEYEDD